MTDLGQRTSAQNAEGARAVKRVLHLFERRWHGWARYTVEDGYPADRLAAGAVFSVEVVESGWVRRPRGAPFMRFDLAPEMVNLGERWATLAANDPKDWLVPCQHCERGNVVSLHADGFVWANGKRLP